MSKINFLEYTYDGLVSHINALKPIPIDKPKYKNIDIEIRQGTIDHSERKNKRILIPVENVRPIQTKYNVQDFDFESYIHIALKALFTPYLVANSKHRPTVDPHFLGGFRVVFSLLPEIRTALFVPFVDDENNLPIYQYACLLYTNNYTHGIALVPDAFPKCAHVHMNGSTCYVQYYECVLDALDRIDKIEQKREQLPIIQLNTPSLPFKIYRTSVLGQGAQGSVYDIDEDRVVKIFQIGIPTGRIEQSFEEQAAIKETLILFYLQTKNFPYAPRALSFGLFNGIFYFIEMNKIKGTAPTNAQEISMCQKSLDELHKLGIIHNDIHLGNLLIREKKTGCLLIDYGLARFVSEFDVEDRPIVLDDETADLKRFSFFS